MRVLRLLLILASVTALVGCDGIGAGIGAGGGGYGTGARSVSLFGRAVKVHAPEGYCIDRRLSDTDSGFVVMAGCALVSTARIMPQIDGLITVQVGAPGTATVTGNEAEISALLSSDEGRSVLSSQGDAASVSMTQVQVSRHVVEVLFQEPGAGPIAGLEPEQWRALFDLDGRLVTVGVRSYSRAPLSKAAGGRLLRMTVAALKAANPA